MRNVIYAGTEWEVIYEGELILHLRSLKDRELIIHCSSKSEFLRNVEETKYIDSGSFGDREVNKPEKSGSIDHNNPEYRTETTSV